MNKLNNKEVVNENNITIQKVILCMNSRIKESLDSKFGLNNIIKRYEKKDSAVISSLVSIHQSDYKNFISIYRVMNLVNKNEMTRLVRSSIEVLNLIESKCSYDSNENTNKVREEYLLNIEVELEDVELDCKDIKEKEEVDTYDNVLNDLLKSLDEYLESDGTEFRNLFNSSVRFINSVLTVEVSRFTRKFSNTKYSVKYIKEELLNGNIPKNEIRDLITVLSKQIKSSYYKTSNKDSSSNLNGQNLLFNPDDFKRLRFKSNCPSLDIITYCNENNIKNIDDVKNYNKTISKSDKTLSVSRLNNKKELYNFSSKKILNKIIKIYEENRDFNIITLKDCYLYNTGVITYKGYNISIFNTFIVIREWNSTQSVGSDRYDVMDIMNNLSLVYSNCEDCFIVKTTLESLDLISCFIIVNLYKFMNGGIEIKDLNNSFKVIHNNYELKFYVEDNKVKIIKEFK